MRTRIGRWQGIRGTFTYSANMELCGITGDFAGGYVQINAHAMEVNPTAGNWVALQAHIDGVVTGPSRIIWQASGQSNIQVGYNMSVRVPPGRHRVGVILTSSGAAGFAGNGGYIDVAE